jgi:uncharacterized protein YPO0396
MVTKWLNARHTGLHVRVQVVRESKVKAPMPEFRPDGFLRKLVWRQHRYREWLKQHLQRFDLSCVADTATLDVTPFSMTREGLIHKEKGRFEKKDLSRIDDRNEWQLGFSNVSRLNSHWHESNRAWTANAKTYWSASMSSTRSWRVPSSNRALT